MVDKHPTCRLCGQTKVQDLGTIPDSDFFAGRALSSVISGGHLWRCVACRSMFRHPVMAARQYLELYQAGAPTQWTGGEQRLDFRLLRASLSARPDVDSVLDVGCGSGDFLASLPAGMARFGVEPAPQAARSAQSRGISIVAPTITQVPAAAQFAAVTMIDVIEHVLDPAQFLTDAYDHVRPGGILVVSTGDPGNAMWRRVFRSRFWYCAFPEHISFPSSSFFQEWSQRHWAVSVDRLVTRHERLTWGHSALGLLMQFGYLVSPAIFSLVGRVGGKLIRSLNGDRRYYAPGIPGLFADHQILAITRSLDT